MVCRTKIISPAGNVFDGILSGIVPASDAIRFEFNDGSELTMPGEYPEMATRIRGKGLKGLHKVDHELNFRTGHVTTFNFAKFDPEKIKADKATKAAKDAAAELLAPKS